jgi:hypothetical protein
LGISAAALNALDPSRARNEIDRQKRILKRRQIVSEFRTARELPRRSFLPGFQPRDTPITGHALSVPAWRLKMLGRKLVCGTTWILNNQSYIEVDHVIDVHIVNQIGTDYATGFIDQYGGRTHRGPGIDIGQARPAEDTQSAIFQIKIWGMKLIHASVINALSAKAEREELHP